jgi:hypothetical protein
MSTRNSEPKPSRFSLKKDSLKKEAETLRQTAKRARDPETRQEFEAMAERREILVQAIDELEADPPAEETARKRGKTSAESS